MLKKVIKSIKDGTFFKKVNKKIRSIHYKRLTKKSNIKLVNNQVMFITFQGDYTCNSKAICDYILKNKLDYKIIWVIRSEKENDIKQFPHGIKVVSRDSNEFYYEYERSKFIFDNSTNFAYMNLFKREGQIVIQTWHGSMGFKRIDPSSVSDKDWLEKAISSANADDYIITNSKFEENVFRGSYWPKTEFLKVGHPRNDILFNKNNEFLNYDKKIRKMYNIKKDTKICLYAPTFRNSDSISCYDLDYNRLHEALVKRFSGDWVILVRYHFRLKNTKVPKKYENTVINVTNYPDMQELLCVTDFGITDYSSWICDYVITKRPGFLYTTDIEKYIDTERGFYHTLDYYPFPICKNNDELYNKIINFDDKKYLKDVNSFLRKVNCYEKGDASKKVVDKMNKLIK